MRRRAPVELSGVRWRSAVARGLDCPTLDAKVTELTLGLARPWEADGDLALGADRLWLEGDLALDASGLDRPHDIATMGLERLPGKTGRLELRADGAEAGTGLRLTADGSRPSLSVGGGRLSGRINAQGARLEIEAGEGGHSGLDAGTLN